MTLIIAAKYPFEEIINLPNRYHMITQEGQIRSYMSHKEAFLNGAFIDAAMIFADSRLTYLDSHNQKTLREDIAQKAYILTPNVCVAFCGLVWVALACIDRICNYLIGQPIVDPDLIAQQIAAKINEVYHENNWNCHSNRVKFILGINDQIKGANLYKIQPSFNYLFIAQKVQDMTTIGGTLPNGELELALRVKMKEAIDYHLKKPGMFTVDFTNAFFALRIALERIIKEQIDKSVGGLVQNLVLDSNGIYPMSVATISTDQTKRMRVTRPSDVGWVMTDDNDDIIEEARHLKY